MAREDYDLPRGPANWVPLSPLSFIKRSAEVYPDRLAVVHGAYRAGWAETYARCVRLASALALWGVGRSDTVAVLAPNIPALVEAHFGVPMTGAVLCALNTRLDAATVAFILRHGEARVLLTDTEFAPVVRAALEGLAPGERPRVVDIADPEGPGGDRLGELDYEAFLAGGDPAYAWAMPPDEWDAIALNYTSGTTDIPQVSALPAAFR